MTHPSLFDPVVTPTESVPWTELVWENGRTYRWRVPHGAKGDWWNAYTTQAPGPYRFELEVETAGGWREVRYHVRRDEIWNHVRQNAEEN